MPAKRCKKNAQFGLAGKLGAQWPHSASNCGQVP